MMLKSGWKNDALRFCQEQQDRQTKAEILENKPWILFWTLTCEPIMIHSILEPPSDWDRPLKDPSVGISLCTTISVLKGLAKDIKMRR